MKILNWLKEHKILLFILFIGAVLRLYKLDYQSLWIDEIFSMIQASPENPIGKIYSYLRENDPHPPLYYFSLHSFLILFGDTVWVGRFFSAFCGIIGIIAIYFLAKEILNKKIGLLAAFLTAINYFHIYYSQEVRMYSLMFLTTTLSFLYLIKFIKSPSKKSMLWYSLFALLMIYTQFFSLFTLFSQYVILLYFVLRPYKIGSRKFLMLSFLSGFITLIFYIPGILIFLKTSEMNSIWIQLPDIDVYTKMVKEFFGFSEVLIFLIGILSMSFFIKLFKRESIKEGYINPIDEKQVFSFFVIFIWIFVTILIPLIASYVNLPMIVSRYFINILPAILILVGSGLYYIKNSALQGIIVITFFIFTITDIFFIKDYYNKITKSQFDELTTIINTDSKSDTRVVTYWSWLMPFYFEENPNIKIQPNTLDEYISGLRNEVHTKIPFWYLDGHSRPLSLSPDNQLYLENNFITKRKVERFDCWANYFVPKDYKEEFIVDEISIKNFKSQYIDKQGFMFIFENSTIESAFTELKEGKYQLIFEGISLPQKPINNENAHIKIKMNDDIIADFFLSEKENVTNVFDFEILNTKKVKFKIQFDNDIAHNNEDRNAVIKNFKIERKK
ncbi:glycosyltransferase family 39 protein [Flavobacterium lacus]|uniref:Dolichyl-phosphate-mannose-protein mannosyltransferase n=1 Tax=Flavobacterium lacus TaxID=1353778 RepID=A0A328X2T6_9FLAO|nr:glycosyltransferase family 39 protein [Flavobacterium lacus]RAR49718.1 dolichyl-phosphate-mannose-protein mannosyltransferase [Flavobacterium lacus]